MSPTEDYKLIDGNTIPCYIPTDRNDIKEAVSKKDYIWMPKWNDNTPAGYDQLSTHKKHMGASIASFKNGDNVGIFSKRRHPK